MNIEFVPFQEALELKELGFDEPCFKGYTMEYKHLITFTNNPTNSSIENALPTQPFTAPLYQQAFRFFRDKFDLNSIIGIQDVDSNQYEYEILEKKEGNYNNDLHFATDYGTYEEAELACLQKLIEIAKNIH